MTPEEEAREAWVSCVTPCEDCKRAAWDRLTDDERADWIARYVQVDRGIWAAQMRRDLAR